MVSEVRCENSPARLTPRGAVQWSSKRLPLQPSIWLAAGFAPLAFLPSHCACDLVARPSRLSGRSHPSERTATSPLSRFCLRANQTGMQTTAHVDDLLERLIVDRRVIKQSSQPRVSAIMPGCRYRRLRDLDIRPYIMSRNTNESTTINSSSS